MESLTDKIIQQLENIKDSTGSEMYKKGVDQAIHRIKKCEEDADFEEVARIMVKHLNNPEKYHPHHTVFIDSTRAELFEGKQSTGPIHDYLLD